MNQKTTFLSVAGILVLAFVMAVMIYKNHHASQQGDVASQNQQVVERQGAPLEGPLDAKVTIVEFFDPACGTCRDFYPLVKKLIDQYPGKVRVMMRYAPLHTGSDEVVKMLEAAHLQGKFFPALELLFNNQQFTRCKPGYSAGCYEWPGTQNQGDPGIFCQWQALAQLWLSTIDPIGERRGRRFLLSQTLPMR